MGGNEAGLARTLSFVVPAGFGLVYVLSALTRDVPAWSRIAGALLVTGAFGALLAWIRRPDGRLLTVQAVLTGVVVLGFEAPVGMIGVLCGALALASVWPGVAAAFCCGVAVAAVRVGGVPGDATINLLLGAMVLYGMVWLAEAVAERAAARAELAMAAVERERLRIAEELNERIGAALTGIAAGFRELAATGTDTAGMREVLGTARACLAEARAVAADFRSLSLAPEMATARALLGSAGIAVEVRAGHAEPLGAAGGVLAEVLRRGVGEVVRAGSAGRCEISTGERDGLVVLRIANDGAATADLGAAGLAEVAARTDGAGGSFTSGLRSDGWFVIEAAVRAPGRDRPAPPRPARIAALLLAVLLGGFLVKGMLPVPWGAEFVAVAVCLGAVGALQLRWRSAARPARWPVLLAAQAVLSYVPAIWFGSVWLGVPSFLAGTLLIAFGRPFVVLPPVMASVAAMGIALGEPAAVVVNYTASTLLTGLIVYAFVRLAQLVTESQAAGAELARAATVRERLRAARDLHDLLGHSLAAILLKGELAVRLPGERARAELAEAAGLAERAGAELHASGVMGLGEELASARSVLAAAGVELDVDAAHAFDGEASAVLGIVVREAVTNILRHSTATRCVITTSPGGLSVANDGAGPSDRPPGSGLGNLTTRLAELDGTLAVRRDGRRFTITASLPPGRSAPRRDVPAR
ncbi:sensor histidine kinase [Actinocorallia longicatena]|uniref:Histidine kinase n=1 Tax=Actinocorallia longicatena TaxID=111803 RepID=A0ABP6QPL7_9ACTN